MLRILSSSWSESTNKCISLYSTWRRIFHNPKWGGCGPQRGEQGSDHHAPGRVLTEDFSSAEEDCCPQDHPDRTVPVGWRRDACQSLCVVLPTEACAGCSLRAPQSPVAMPQPSAAPKAGIRQVGEQRIAYKAQTGASPQAPDLPRTGTGAAALLTNPLPFLALLLK